MNKEKKKELIKKATEFVKRVCEGKETHPQEIAVMPEMFKALMELDDIDYENEELEKKIADIEVKVEEQRIDMEISVIALIKQALIMASLLKKIEENE